MHLQVELSTHAHVGGVALADMRGDVAVSCGYSGRSGAAAAEPFIKVWWWRWSTRPHA